MRRGLTDAERAAIAAFLGPIRRIPAGAYTDEIRNSYGKVIARKLVMPGEPTPWKTPIERNAARRRAARGQAHS